MASPNLRKLDDAIYWLNTHQVLTMVVRDPVTNEPVDLTGATAVDWAVAKDANTAPMVTKGLSTGVTLTPGVVGGISVQLVPADAAAFIIVGLLYQEAKMTKSAVRTMLGWGQFTARRTVLGP